MRVKLRTKFGQPRIGKTDIARTFATGLRAFMTHWTFSRTLSHVFERLIAFMASWASRSALLAGEIAARASAAGGIEVVPGEGAPETVATAASGDSKLALIGNKEWEVVFGDTVTAK